MKKLMAWNKCYGFEAFEVFIAYGETLEEKKAYYESIGYKCWVEEEINEKFSFKRKNIRSNRNIKNIRKIKMEVNNE